MVKNGHMALAKLSHGSAKKLPYDSSYKYLPHVSSKTLSHHPMALVKLIITEHHGNNCHGIKTTPATKPVRHVHVRLLHQEGVLVVGVGGGHSYLTSLHMTTP